MNAAFALRQGEVSGLLETPSSFCIIKITETYAQRNLTLDDMMLGYGVTVREFIRAGLTEQTQQEVLERIQQELVDELRRGNPFQIFANNLNW
jgi:parvulin-like peptidyl-prolyl isomerase